MGNSESNVGARLVVIGKAAFLASMKEATAAAAEFNKTVAAGAKASAEASASQDAFYAAGGKSYKQYLDEQTARTEAQAAAVTGIGKKATFALGAVGAVIGYESLKIHSSFQAAMTQVSTLAGVHQDRLADLTAGIKQLSPQVNQGLTPLANALYRIASTPAGLKATNAELLNMTKYAGMLATIGGSTTTLEQTARIIGGAMSTGVKGVGSPKNIVSLAAATVGSGDIRMSDFVNFLGTGVLTSGKLTGVTMPQVAAFLALAGSNLQSGQVSGHGLAHGLQLMAAPTPAAQKALGAIGLGATTLAHTMRTKGLGAAVAQLYQHLSGPLTRDADPNSGGLMTTLTKYGLTSAQISRAQKTGLTKTAQNLILTRMFGGAKMGIPLDMLVTEHKNYDATYAHMQKTSGNFAKAWAQQTDTLAFKTGAFGKSLANLADTIGATLTPVAKVFLGIGTDFFNLLASNKVAAMGFATVVTGILGPAIGFYLKAKFADAAKSMAMVIQWYAKLVRAILGRFIPSLRAEDAAIGTNDATLATNDRALVANDGAIATNAEERAASGGSSFATGALGKGVGFLGKVSLIGAAAAIAAQQGNQYIQHHPALHHWIDSHGGTWVDDQHLKHYLHDVVSAPFAAPHEIDQLFTGHPSSTPSVADLLTGHSSPTVVQSHVHVHIDGKEVFSAVTKQAKKKAARNG